MTSAAICWVCCSRVRVGGCGGTVSSSDSLGVFGGLLTLTRTDSFFGAGDFFFSFLGGGGAALGSSFLAFFFFNT